MKLFARKVTFRGPIDHPNIMDTPAKKCLKIPGIPLQQSSLNLSLIIILLLDNSEFINIRDLDLDLLELLSQGVVGAQLLDDVRVDCVDVVLDLFHLDLLAQAVVLPTGDLQVQELPGLVSASLSLFVALD